MLKKLGLVASSAIGLTMLAAPFASADTGDLPDTPTFGDAVEIFTDGGGAAGYGAAALVAGAYTGVVNTPSQLLDSLNVVGDEGVDLPVLGG